MFGSPVSTGFRFGQIDVAPVAPSGRTTDDGGDAFGRGVRHRSSVSAAPGVNLVRWGRSRTSALWAVAAAAPLPSAPIARAFREGEVREPLRELKRSHTADVAARMGQEGVKGPAAAKASERPRGNTAKNNGPRAVSKLEYCSRGAIHRANRGAEGKALHRSASRHLLDETPAVPSSSSSSSAEESRLGGGPRSGAHRERERASEAPRSLGPGEDRSHYRGRKAGRPTSLAPHVAVGKNQRSSAFAESPNTVSECGSVHGATGADHRTTSSKADRRSSRDRGRKAFSPRGKTIRVPATDGGRRYSGAAAGRRNSGSNTGADASAPIASLESSVSSDAEPGSLPGTSVVVDGGPRSSRSLREAGAELPPAVLRAMVAEIQTLLAAHDCGGSVEKGTDPGGYSGESVLRREGVSAHGCSPTHGAVNAYDAGRGAAPAAALLARVRRLPRADRPLSSMLEILAASLAGDIVAACRVADDLLAPDIAEWREGVEDTGTGADSRGVGAVTRLMLACSGRICVPKFLTLRAIFEAHCLLALELTHGDDNEKLFHLRRALAAAEGLPAFGAYLRAAAAWQISQQLFSRAEWSAAHEAGVEAVNHWCAMGGEAPEATATPSRHTEAFLPLQPSLHFFHATALQTTVARFCWLVAWRNGEAAALNAADAALSLRVLRKASGFHTGRAAPPSLKRVTAVHIFAACLAADCACAAGLPVEEEQACDFLASILPSSSALRALANSDPSVLSGGCSELPPFLRSVHGAFLTDVGLLLSCVFAVARALARQHMYTTAQAHVTDLMALFGVGARFCLGSAAPGGEAAAAARAAEFLLADDLTSYIRPILQGVSLTPAFRRGCFELALVVSLCRGDKPSFARLAKMAAATHCASLSIRCVMRLLRGAQAFNSACFTGAFAAAALKLISEEYLGGKVAQLSSRGLSAALPYSAGEMPLGRIDAAAAGSFDCAGDAAGLLTAVAAASQAAAAAAATGSPFGGLSSGSGPLETEAGADECASIEREALQLLRALRPADVECRLRLGSSLRRANMAQQAEDCLREVLALQPHCAQAALELGFVAFDRKDYDESFRQLSAVVSGLDCSLANAELFSKLAISAERAVPPQPEAAAAAWERAGALEPGNLEALYRRATLLMRPPFEDLQQAEDLLRRLVRCAETTPPRRGRSGEFKTPGGAAVTVCNATLVLSELLEGRNDFDGARTVLVKFAGNLHGAGAGELPETAARRAFLQASFELAANRPSSALRGIERIERISGGVGGLPTAIAARVYGLRAHALLRLQDSDVGQALEAAAAAHALAGGSDFADAALLAYCRALAGAASSSVAIPLLRERAQGFAPNDWRRRLVDFLEGYMALCARDFEGAAAVFRRLAADPCPTGHFRVAANSSFFFLLSLYFASLPGGYRSEIGRFNAEAAAPARERTVRELREAVTRARRESRALDAFLADIGGKISAGCDPDEVALWAKTSAEARDLLIAGERPPMPPFVLWQGLCGVARWLTESVSPAAAAAVKAGKSRATSPDAKREFLPFRPDDALYARVVREPRSAGCRSPSSGRSTTATVHEYGVVAPSHVRVVHPPTAPEVRRGAPRQNAAPRAASPSAAPSLPASPAHRRSRPCSASPPAATGLTPRSIVATTSPLRSAKSGVPRPADAGAKQERRRSKQGGLSGGRERIAEQADDNRLRRGGTGPASSRPAATPPAVAAPPAAAARKLPRAASPAALCAGSSAASASAAPPWVVGPQWLLDPADLEIGRCLGSGGFGAVYAGKLKSANRPVAVKRLHVDPARMRQREWDDITSEVLAALYLKHPNLIEFVGVCFEPQRLSLVTALCPRGSLYAGLHAAGKPGLPRDFALRMKIALDVTRGVAFLHAQNPKIVHRDLKSLNVVLGDDFTAMLCDFGLTTSMDLCKSHISLKPGAFGGSPRYMAPECFDSHARITEKVDVWALGCILIEVFGGGLPFKECREVAEIMRVLLVDRKPPSIPPAFPSDLAHIVRGCLRTDPKNRWDTSKVLARLPNVGHFTIL